DVGALGEDCDLCDDIGDVGADCDPCDDIGDVGADCESVTTTTTTTIATEVLGEVEVAGEAEAVLADVSFTG
ncbi:hypothetical protein OAM92_02725, partial [Acidimicrobiales bacterium]|nr:hypothetical protein [Acidimicrobiales bacterium]